MAAEPRRLGHREVSLRDRHEERREQLILFLPKGTIGWKQPGVYDHSIVTNSLELVRELLGGGTRANGDVAQVVK